jgi:hypothetical protein
VKIVYDFRQASDFQQAVSSMLSRIQIKIERDTVIAVCQTQLDFAALFLFRILYFPRIFDNRDDISGHIWKTIEKYSLSQMIFSFIAHLFSVNLSES